MEVIVHYGREAADPREMFGPGWWLMLGGWIVAALEWLAAHG
jgi:hypothetical protein